MGEWLVGEYARSVGSQVSESPARTRTCSEIHVLVAANSQRLLPPVSRFLQSVKVRPPTAIPNRHPQATKLNPKDPRVAASAAVEARVSSLEEGASAEDDRLLALVSELMPPSTLTPTPTPTPTPAVTPPRTPPPPPSPSPPLLSTTLHHPSRPSTPMSYTHHRRPRYGRCWARSAVRRSWEARVVVLVAAVVGLVSSEW